MSAPVLRSFAAQIGELEEAIGGEWRWPSPDTAFAKWLARRLDLPTPGPSEQVAFGADRWNEAPVLATAGFLLASDGLDGPDRSHWASGMARVVQRDPLPADRNSFAFRPIELLGIAVGVAHAGDAQTTTWLREAIERGTRLLASDPWGDAVTGWAARMVGARWDVAAGEADTDVLGLRLVEQPTGSDLARFLVEASVRVAPASDLPRTIVRWAALRVSVGRVTRGITLATATDAVDLVERLCRRFPAFLSQLGQRHDRRATLVVTDEYDVQDALHAVLRLHFPDVRDEESSPSHAATTTRLDLLIKGERIVVEAKMTRAGMTQRKLVEEIAIDKERYRQHPDCGAVIFFVYDPGAHLKNPVALEKDASETLGGIRCIVIVAPRDHGAERLATAETALT